MKNLLYVAIVISAVIIINELAYLGETSLAWVIIGLAVSIILIAIYQLVEKEK